MIEAIGGRKFLVGLLLLAIAVALQVFTPQGLTPVMATFLVGIGTTYFMANIQSKKVSSGGSPETGEEPAATPAPLPEPSKPEPVSEQDQMAKAIAEALSKEFKPALQGIANQNAVIAQIVGDVAKGTTFLTNYVSQTQAQR
jgi:hypothetical protein